MDGLSVDWGSGGPWLPAYGLIGDGGLFLPPQCALLETILEEEDEFEDSDSSAEELSSDGEEEEEDTSTGSGSPGGDGAHSDWGGWGGSSGSDVQSVIHIEPNGDINDDGNDSGSERDFVCPPKRRRCNDQHHLTAASGAVSYPLDLQYDSGSLTGGYCHSDEDARSFTSLSRSSSLLQFESLERQMLQSCDSLQHCGATDAVDGTNAAAVTDKKHHLAGVDTATSDSDSELSDATVHSKTTDDDLAPLHEVAKVIHQRSAENLSEDSGYCDGTCNFVRLAKAKSIPCFNKYGAVGFNNGCVKRVAEFVGHFGAEGRYRRRCRSFDDVSSSADCNGSVACSPGVNIDARAERARKSTTMASAPPPQPSLSSTARQTRNKRAVSLSSPCLLKAFGDPTPAGCDVLRSSARRREFVRDLDRLQLLDNTYRRLHEEEHNRYHLEDSVRVSSVPEDLNLCSSADDDARSCDWSLFTDAHDSIAAKNFDLYDFGATTRSPRDAPPPGRTNASFTTSCADLTALDYADGGRGCFAGGVRMSSTRRSASSPKTNKTLFDEISEHFDRNLSILTDREVDSTYAVPVKKTSSATFDVDPTNLVTCYAESLERCTFPLDSHTTPTNVSQCDVQRSQFRDSEVVFFHSTPEKRELVVSTPNLNSASAHDRYVEKVYKEDLRASMQHVPIKDEDYATRPGGILGSKHQSSTSVGTSKGVHFCPVVSEVSWRERSYSEDTQRSDSYATSSGSYSSDDNIAVPNASARVCERPPSPLPQTIHRQLSSATTTTTIITKSHVTPTMRDYKSVTEDPRFVLIRPPDVPADLTEAGRTRPNAAERAASPRDRTITNEQSERYARAQTTTTTIDNNKPNNGRSAASDNNNDKKSADNKCNRMETNTVTAKMSTAFRKPAKKPGFLARFASFRFPSRKKHDVGKSAVKTTCDAQVSVKPQQVLDATARQDAVLRSTDGEYIYIPLKGPDAVDRALLQRYEPRQQQPQLSNDSAARGPSQAHVVVASKPPLPRQPPRIVGVCAKRTKHEHAHCGEGADATNTGAPDNDGGHTARRVIDQPVARPDGGCEHGSPRRTMARMVGLIETDLDTHETVVCNGKARSLIDLGETHVHGHGRHLNHNLSLANHQQTTAGAEPPRPHKSMEFLLDKENHKEALPPENELQKTSSTSMSEHQLRVQRSLQRLDLPDWYRQSQVPREGFLLRKRSSPDERGPAAAGCTRWTGLNSKTTSLNSLGASAAAAAAHRAGAPNGGHAPPSGGYLLSPSSHRDFCRWSTSKLNSSQTSPSSSVRSSFSSRTAGPVLTNSSGAASLRSSFRQPYLGWRSQEKLTRPRTPAERLAGSILPQQAHAAEAQTPEIQSSIKEVTSAIVHYVTDAHSRLQQPNESHLQARPPSSQGRSRSASPSQRLCWLESSFVGTRPLDSPQTPVISKTFDSPAVDGDRRDSTGLKLELRRPERYTNESSTTPGSATLEDVLASLLGLRPNSAMGQATTPSGALPAGNADTASALDPLRRRSEGDTAASTPSVGRARRPSLGSGTADQPAACLPVKCRNGNCPSVAETAEARKKYKNCHNCSYMYCSRECRRAHWEKHRKFCLHSRVSTLCRQVINSSKDDEMSLRHISSVARQGYEAQGRGVVKLTFKSPESAESFVKNGFQKLGDMTYVKWPDLIAAEMGPELYSELLRLCTAYEPSVKLVLYVSICVVSEAPASGAVKWERQLVSRCAKLRLAKSTMRETAAVETPETIIFASLSAGDGSQRTRELCVENVHRHLRKKGINLRRHFPEIHQKLSSYADNCCDRFPPLTFYPKDPKTGRSFMCIIMPVVDREKLSVLPADKARIKIVDVSLKLESEASPTI